MNPKKILLVEDNPSDSSLIQRALARVRVANGVVLAEDGEEALDYLFGTGAHQGRDVTDLPALVLLDLRLPKLSGLEVLRRIRSHPRTVRLPVVMLTASEEERDAPACYDLGVNSFIRKPVDAERFCAAVEQIGLYWVLINEAPPAPTAEAANG